MSSRERAGVVPLDEVVRVLRIFARASWPIPEDTIPALVQSLGWRLVSEPQAKFPEADTGWTISRPTADFLSGNGELTEVTFRVTDVLREETQSRADFLNNAFVQISRAVSDVLGRPVYETKRAGSLYANWDLPNRGAISLTAIETSVGVDVASAKWAEVNRRIEQ